MKSVINWVICWSYALWFVRHFQSAIGVAPMFTAQVNANGPMGMNHPDAQQNAQFALNVLHWLTGSLSE